MKRIGILSDTHSYYEPKLNDFFKDCDEVWHAGDIGNEEVLNQLSIFPLTRAVSGNIDDWKIRTICAPSLSFVCENVKAIMIHIGGSPGNYMPELRKLISKEQPQLIVCGHSHILKVMFDKTHNCLFINPGAIGKHGFHAVRTAVRLVIEGNKMRDLEVLELKR